MLESSFLKTLQRSLLETAHFLSFSLLLQELIAKFSFFKNFSKGIRFFLGEESSTFRLEIQGKPKETEFRKRVSEKRSDVLGNRSTERLSRLLDAGHWLPANVFVFKSLSQAAN